MATKLMICEYSYCLYCKRTVNNIVFLHCFPGILDWFYEFLTIPSCTVFTCQWKAAVSLVRFQGIICLHLQATSKMLKLCSDMLIKLISIHSHEYITSLLSQCRVVLDHNITVFLLFFPHWILILKYEIKCTSDNIKSTTCDKHERQIFIFGSKVNLP